MNYRKIWESHYGKIPIDERGVTYDIHHIDGDRKNNKIENLICLSVNDHYKVHYKQYIENPNHKDFAALVFLCSRLNKSTESLTGHTVSEETRNKIRNSLKGKKRPKEIGERVSKSLKNYKWSEDALKKRSIGLKKYYQRLSEDEKKIRAKKISERMIGTKLKEETKEKLSKFNSKLKDEEVLNIDKLIRDNVPYRIISMEYNISPAQITAIKHRKTYKWLWNTGQGN